jgi:hypothetical protein
MPGSIAATARTTDAPEEDGGILLLHLRLAYDSDTLLANDLLTAELLPIFHIGRR